MIEDRNLKAIGQDCFHQVVRITNYKVMDYAIHLEDQLSDVGLLSSERYTKSSTTSKLIVDFLKDRHQSADLKR